MSDLSRNPGEFLDIQLSAANVSRVWGGNHASFITGKLNPLQIQNPAVEVDSAPENNMA